MAITLKEYINQVLLDMGKDLELEKQIEEKVHELARKELNGEDGCIDNETIKEWVIKLANEEKVVVEEKKAVKKPKTNKVEEKIKSEESLGAKEKAFGKDYAITSLF